MNGKLKAVSSRAAAVWATRVGKAALLGGAAVVLAGGGAVAATTLPINSVGTAQIQNGAVTYDKVGVNSVASSRIQDHSVGWNDMAKDAASGYTLRDGTVAERDLAPSVLDKLEVGGVVANQTFEPTTVANIGGRFADRATEVGTVTLPAGKLKVDLDGFWTTLAAGPAGTRPQLALRGPNSKDFGTIFPGEASPAKDREITGHSTKLITLDAPTEVTVYAFGYNDDTSSAGGGRLQVTASVVATNA